MNCSFLQSYTIPRATEGTPTSVTATYIHAEAQPALPQAIAPEERSRFFGNSNISTAFAARSRKRKYSNGETPIAETTGDGQLVLFEGRDASYPNELNKLIHPLKCDLCKAEMNSLISAGDHFKSKSHDRNITAWLKTNYVDKGLAAPPVKRFLSKGPAGQDAFHCTLCDLQLTSVGHASQHYAGRKHRAVAEKMTKPSGSGYYKEDGSWVRTGSKAQSKLHANDGRFGIGETFRTGGDLVAPAKEEIINKDLHCGVCDVYTTSQLQMETHLTGSKHAKKLKMLALESHPIIIGNAAELMNGSAPALNAATVLEASLKDSTNGDSDFSTYRTPSGLYYCKTCDLSMPNVKALQPHLNGKKHLKRAADERDTKTQQHTKK